jgi:FKBP-type peptidyl-prolyl cis-trans isomerase SlyD
MNQRGTERAPVVKDGLQVNLEYSLRLADGALVSNSEGHGPLVFVQGQGQVLAGLERALYGMAVGDEKVVVIAPADAYGERDPDARDILPRDAFPADMHLEPGMGIRMRCNSGRRIDAYVDEIRSDDVVLDLNHPLAGETLLIHVKVATLRSTTQEEPVH